MFDYIIVGAGAAGCVLANRLSADPTKHVLLLEAGPPDKKMEIRIPAAFPKLFKSEIDWDYETDEQSGLSNRRLYIPRGKTLGGSSSMNGQMFVRGNPRDFDEWEELAGPGWSHADILPYFRRIERFEGEGSNLRGRDGELSITYPRSTNPLSHAFVAACRESGIELNPDYNGENQEGIGWTQVTHLNGQRHSAADAYLRPASARKNLQVETDALVTRVVFDGRRVSGVEYRQGGALRQAQAKREVILSGGTLNSPQLLMLSGVGPAEELRDLGIPVVADLPGVGRNLQDHLLVVAAYDCTQPVSMMTVENPLNLLRYLLFKRGPLTSNVVEATAFVTTEPRMQRPDIQILFGPLYFLNHGFTRPDGHGFSIAPVLLHPESRGRVSLRSVDPGQPPSIQPNFLRSEADLDKLVAGVKLCRQIVRKGRAFDAYRGAEYCPGEGATSDAALAEFVRETAETLYHPVGTCKMGEDALAVVDRDLCVRGLSGLRVVDASIMPTITSGNTYAPTLMIAEKAADLILQAAAGRPVHSVRRAPAVHA